MTNLREQRFQAICAAGDRLVKETGKSPSEISGYAVSMAAFNKKPNGDFYALFADWQKQRGAVPGTPPVGMPPDAAASFKEWIDHHADQSKIQLMQQVTNIVSSVAAAFDQASTIRSTALEHMCSDLVRQKQEVIETLKETDVELEEAKALILSLTKKLDEAHDQMQRLRGQQEERELLLKMLMPDADVAVAPSAFRRKAADDDEHGDTDGPASNETIADLKAEPEGHPVSLFGNVELPTAIKSDHSTDGQVEMPFGTNGSADQPNVAKHDDNN